MYKIDFEHPVHAHFIGIGGISMSCFAMLLHSEGFTVSGSDGKKTPLTEEMASQGISILYGQRASNITENIDFVVYTAAIHPDNPEFAAAKAAGLPMLGRAEMVGQVMENYEKSIAVSGTHGKTTTTSMIAHILLAADLDPTISVGGMLKAIDGNLRIGKSEYFLTEACEYTNSFLHFRPRMSIILNVEADHLDFFKDIEDIRHSFKTFADLLPDDGLLIINGEIPDAGYFYSDLSCKVITYGLGDGEYDYSADNITFDRLGRASYDLIRHGSLLGRINLNVVGIHNVSNSLPAIALALHLGLPLDIIQNGLTSFTGTDRRFEYKGEIGGVTVIDDYAHHPTEIKATLSAVSNMDFNRVWCVFQPHTYSRTKALFQDFVDALSLADNVILADIYAAREKNPGDISSRDLKRELETAGKNVWYFPSFDEIENFLLENCTQGDLLITMGAGDVVNIGEALLGM
ncbi:UDP-N-acetylmuramate--L-alanine ligase [Anaerolentibacter hominis]|uniref:UDP-N-acetylmuramate--L-alanine ligase n=1 Tax=Anaerolentibacter hominis TaxID=3079009 RepID=UPI0031B846F4